MQPEPYHRAIVFATPWSGVHGTQLDSARCFGRHWHSTYGIGLIERGAQRSVSGCGVVQAFENDVIATNPGEVHDGGPLCVPARRWRMLYLDVGVLPGDPLIRPVMRDKALTAALRLLFISIDDWQHLQHGGVADLARLRCDDALTTCMARLRRPRARPAPPPVAMQRVHQRLSDDVLRAPTLAELAELAGCSRFQVLRHFGRAYGMTPHAWLLARRANAAQRAIARGTSLIEAAAASGFADQSHMTRVFVRHHGYTPGAFAAAVQ